MLVKYLKRIINLINNWFEYPQSMNYEPTLPCKPGRVRSWFLQYVRCGPVFI